jgi:protein ImuB
VSDISPLFQSFKSFKSFVLALDIARIRGYPAQERNGGSWPGRVPAPSPATVHAAPIRAEVVDRSGQPVVVNGRGSASAEPKRVSIDGGRWTDVVAWAGPWPVDERWWAADEAHRCARFQFQLADGRALLVVLAGSRWQVQGVYD